MKTTFKANLLKHLITKKEEGGFTLIELLVVIIIIGILAAIALPSFLNQANKARQSEAQTYTGSVNRAQQAYYLENAQFSTPVAPVTSAQALGKLGLGISAETDNYLYTIVGAEPAKGASVHAAPAKRNADDTATEADKDSSLLGFQGSTVIASTTDDASGEATTVAILCKSDKTPLQTGALLGFTDIKGDGVKTPDCPPNFSPIK